jgi:hypothetical protein
MDEQKGYEGATTVANVAGPGAAIGSLKDVRRPTATERLDQILASNKHMIAEAGKVNEAAAELRRRLEGVSPEMNEVMGRLISGW